MRYAKSRLVALADWTISYAGLWGARAVDRGARSVARRSWRAHEFLVAAGLGVATPRRGWPATAAPGGFKRSTLSGADAPTKMLERHVAQISAHPSLMVTEAQAVRTSARRPLGTRSANRVSCKHSS
jgi:hypothetical protein